MVEKSVARDTSLDARASAGEGVMKVDIGSKQGVEVLAETLDVSLDGFEVHSLKVNISFGSGVFLFSHLLFFFSFLRGAGKNNHVFDSQHDGVELEGAVRRALCFYFPGFPRLYNLTNIRYSFSVFSKCRAVDAEKQTVGSATAGLQDHICTLQSIKDESFLFSPVEASHVRFFQQVNTARRYDR